MNADILTDAVEFFSAPSGQRVRVAVGQTIRVNLNEAPEGIVFATTKDSVLQVDELGTGVRVAVKNTGTSEVQVQVNRAVAFYLTIEAFNPTEATSLGASAGKAQQK